jgi:SPP1 family predicted phage head-tail adaptor
MRSYVEAGKLRQIVQIVDPTQVTTVQDSFGGNVAGQEQPLVIARDLPASIEFVSDKMVYSAQQYVSQVTHKVTIRWMPGITAKQEVVYLDPEGRQRVLQVQGVGNPDERNRMLVLNCLERNDSLFENVTVPPA